MLIAISANALERRKKDTETLVKYFDFIALEGIRHTCKALGLPVRVVEQVKCLRSYLTTLPLIWGCHCREPCEDDYCCVCTL